VYFEDLTPYSYSQAPRQDVLNVGWLSCDHPFATGEVSEHFVAALAELVKNPVNLFRGIHLCEFCPPPPKKLSPMGLPLLDPGPGTIGNGEVRVKGDGITFVAPTLVLHYVEAHGYLPPKGFIEAVTQPARRPNTSFERTREG
jgi:hypothetical protein